MYVHIHVAHREFNIMRLATFFFSFFCYRLEECEEQLKQYEHMNEKILSESQDKLNNTVVSLYMRLCLLHGARTCMYMYSVGLPEQALEWVSLGVSYSIDGRVSFEQ